MSTTRINGVDVVFPFAQPYPQQRALMSQTLRCIARGQNGLLEVRRWRHLETTRTHARSIAFLAILVFRRRRVVARRWRCCAPRWRGSARPRLDWRVAIPQ